MTPAPQPDHTLWVTPVPWLGHIRWHWYPCRTIHYGDTHTQARLYIMVTLVPWLDRTLWWHRYPGLTINYGDTHTQAGLYITVTLVPCPDCILWLNYTPWPDHTLWWYLHPGPTLYYGWPTPRLDCVLWWQFHTQAGPYIMATPCSPAWPPLAHKIRPIVNHRWP